MVLPAPSGKSRLPVCPAARQDILHSARCDCDAPASEPPATGNSSETSPLYGKPDGRSFLKSAVESSGWGGFDPYSPELSVAGSNPAWVTIFPSRDPRAWQSAGAPPCDPSPQGACQPEGCLVHAERLEAASCRRWRGFGPRLRSLCALPRSPQPLLLRCSCRPSGVHHGPEARRSVTMIPRKSGRWEAFPVVASSKVL
jgi:hypothetical protein